MKKIAIITLTDNLNYGNRLQNYALSKSIEKMGFETVTLWKKNSFLKNTKEIIKKIIFNAGGYLKKDLKEKSNLLRRRKKFSNFTNQNIKNEYYSFLYNIDETEIFRFVIGSDQIWSPLALEQYPIALCSFVKDKRKITSYAPSVGVSCVNKQYEDKMRRNFTSANIKKISIREKKGKEILEKCLDRNDVEVLIDPTMLLDVSEWNALEKKPKFLNIEKKYILNYFLGKMSKERIDVIEKIAIENDCEIINVLDKNSPFYITGPSEFLYLEKNAFLICTDSFHSCVFALLYNRPFIVFDREDKMESMNSRIENFIEMFKLENCKFKGDIKEENLKNDYNVAYNILEKERKKAHDFLREALKDEE